VYNDPGRARRDGERPPGGNGEDERVGTPEPVYFFWVSVKEKIACERDDIRFIRSSYRGSLSDKAIKFIFLAKSLLKEEDLLHDFIAISHRHFT
jgi:hypothetical protein